MMKATAMTKSARAAATAEGCELKKATASQVLASLASIGTEETQKHGKFVIPGPREASHQGGQEGGLRQSGHGEGEAGADNGQGLLRQGAQGRVLRGFGARARQYCKILHKLQN